VPLRLGRIIHVELHAYGPRAWLLGHRLHEWELGVATVVTVLAGRMLGWWGISDALSIALAVGLWMLIKDWRDIFPRTRDTSTWRLGIHRPALALRTARRGDRLPLALAVATAALGIVNVASALTRNASWRTRVLEGVQLGNYVPFFHTLALPAGALLVVLAFYIARRRHRAWSIAVGLLVALGVVNMLKGLDFEEAIVGWALAALLWWGRDAFYVRHEPASLRSALWRIPAIALGTLTVSTLAVWAAATEGTGTGRVWQATLDLLSLQPAAITYREDFHWVPIAVALASVATALAFAYTVFRPIAAPRGLPDRVLRRSAANLVRSHGTDSLAAFKLRRDLHYLFSLDGQAFVAYRVEAGVMLLAGDPIGAAGALPGLLREVVAFAEKRGLKLAVIGASETLLPAYEQAGLRSFYIGDEAVVETASFSLEGRAIRKVRQAVNRAERAGFTAELRRVDELDPAGVEELEAVSRAWRQGEPERGFSMALDSVAGEHLADSVVVCARDGQGRTRGFLHFVPVHGRRAMSLSFMRREHDTPNGLTEFLVVKSIELLRDRADELSLNFAAFARVMHSPEGLVDRLLASAARLLDPFFQIESLYRFNAKFSPRWEPRYLLYEGAAGLPRAGLAAMWAEGQLPKPRVYRPATRLAA
jgi:lysyl-tRNA synthetase class 2